MNQITLEKLNNNIFHLQKELSFFRSFVFGIIGRDRDKEGKYKPEFIKKILRATEEKTTHIFKDKKNFLYYLKSK
ncbi:MAG: hypothetical protein ABH808_00270 [Candidatus Kuenenbacteria bacterium]